MDINNYEESNMKNHKKAKKLGFKYTFDSDHQNFYLDEKKTNDAGTKRSIQFYPASDSILIKDDDGQCISFSVKEIEEIAKMVKRHDKAYEKTCEAAEEKKDIKKRIETTHKKAVDAMNTIEKMQEKIAFSLKGSKKEVAEKDTETLSFVVPDEILADPEEEYLKVSEAPITPLPFDTDYDLLEL